MEPPKEPAVSIHSAMSHRKCHIRRRWWVAIGVVLAVIAIATIAVPLAVILPNRTETAAAGQPASVLFPLYIYPEDNSTWGPLYEAITNHPTLNFLVVINPDSGPGDGSAPNEQYQAAITQLSTYSNVQKVGYVRTGYGDRDINAVLSEIETYAGWQAESADLAMAGIFFDEVASEYSESIADYLEEINSAVKNDAGVVGTRTVIHNPGTIPDSRLNVPGTDITVVFEQAYDVYINGVKEDLDAIDADRTTWSYIFHSVPQMDDRELQDFVNEISQKAAYLFVTTLSVDFYNNFDPELQRFVNAVTPE
ncbi:Spherulation-specific family 4-domain-containing protein [Aspergillus unguis]